MMTSDIKKGSCPLVGTFAQATFPGQAVIIYGTLIWKSFEHFPENIDKHSTVVFSAYANTRPRLPALSVYDCAR